MEARWPEQIESVIEVVREVLVPALLAAWERPVYAVVAVTVGLLAVVVMLSLGAVLLQWRHSRLTRQLDHLTAQWRISLFGYLEGEGDAAQLAEQVPANRRVHFLWFVASYLRDLVGEEHRRLSELIHELGLGAHLRVLVVRGSGEDRTFAAYYVGLLGDAEALHVLRRALRDPLDSVRMAAATSLMRLKDVESLTPIVKTFGNAVDSLGRIRFLLFEYGPGVMPHLHPMLASDTLPWPAVAPVLSVIGYYQYMQAADAVQHILQTTEDPEVRRSALSCLADLELPDRLPVFERALQSDDPVHRGIAARALGQFGSEHTAEQLRTLLSDDDFWVVRAACTALMNLGPRGVQTLQASAAQPPSPMALALVQETLHEHGPAAGSPAEGGRP